MVKLHVLFVAGITYLTIEMISKVDVTKHLTYNLVEKRDRSSAFILSSNRDKNSNSLILDEILDSLVYYDESPEEDKRYEIPILNELLESKLLDKLDNQQYDLVLPVREISISKESGSESTNYEDDGPESSDKESASKTKHSKLEPLAIDSKIVCSCEERIVKRDTKENNLDFRIIGGRVTKPHAFPQTAYVRYDTKLCGGTILNKHFILTAAHCVQGNDDLTLFEIKVGRYDLKEPEPFGKTVGIKNAVFHPNFTHQTMSDDIALLELNEPLTFNQDVKPTCLQLNDENYEYQLAITVGWGRTMENGSVSAILRQASVPIVPQDKCQEDYEDDVIDQSMICAGYRQGGEDACNVIWMPHFGDSGGPLLLSTTLPLKQIGITSFGYRCARQGKPGVYSNVAYNLKFIIDNSKVPSGCQIYSLHTNN